MATIDIGAGATDREGGAALAGTTTIDFNNPANDTGVLTSVEVYFLQNASGVKIGTFYGSSTSYTNRDYVFIGNVSAGSKYTQACTISVSAGDFIGVYSSAGQLEATTSGGSGLKWCAGDQFGTGAQTYANTIASNILSLYGAGATVSVPTVTLTKPVSYNSSGVNVTGNITDLGGVSATVRGFCYATGGTAVVPVVADSTAGAAGSFGMGEFNYNITGVSSSKLYHVRAFAINSGGTAYSSDQVHFDIETQSSSIGIKSLISQIKLATTKEISFGIKASALTYWRGVWKTFILMGTYRPFTYSFPFLFNTLRDGYPLVLTPLKASTVATTWLSSKIGLYVDSLSMWEYVFNGIKLIIRILSTSIGIAPIKEKISHSKTVLETSFGVVSAYFKNLSFNRQISTKVGALSDIIKNAGIKINLLTQAGIYTKGLWSKYNYSKTVVVNPSTDGALSSYPMKLTIHRTTGTDTTSNVYVGSDCSFDYTDIDFTTTMGIYLEHWVESYTDSYAVVWVKVTNISASPTTTTIIFYYGSTLGSAHNSGENTFTFFDDFSAGLSKWTTDNGCSIVGNELVIQSTSTATNTAYSNTSFGTGYAMRAYLKSAHINATSNVIEDVSFSATGDGHGVGVSYSSYYSAYNNTYYNFNINGRYYLPVSGWSADTYHIQDIIRNSATNSKFYVDNLNLVTLTDTLDTDSHPIRFFTVNNTAKLIVDWVLIRPYTTNEPSFGTWGSKIATAGSPFKEYILKGYIGFSTKAGLLSTKYKGIGHKFSILKIGLVSSMSQEVQFIRELSSKIGIKGSISYAIALLRSLNTAVGFAFSKSAGFVQVLAIALGLVTSEPLKFASYNFIASIGLVSNYIVNKGAVILLATVLGIKSSILKTGLSIQDLTIQLGLIATTGTTVFARVFTSSIGIMVESTSVLKSYFSFISSLGLVSDMVRQYSVFKDLSIKAGLIATEGIRKVDIEIKVYIGLIAGHVKELSYIFRTAIGMLSILSRQISVSIILQKAIGLSLIRETRAYFEEVLSASFGAVSDLWYKSGGRVREFTTSLGLSSFVSNTEGFYRELYYNVGLIATKASNNAIIKDVFTYIGLVSSMGLRTTMNKFLEASLGVQAVLSISLTSFRDLYAVVGMYASKQVLVGVSFIIMIGLMAVKGTISWAESLFTNVGFIAFVDRHRHDLETLSTSIGLVARSTSKWFGQKRFKTLKFLNPATKDNKKLRVQK